MCDVDVQYKKRECVQTYDACDVYWDGCLVTPYSFASALPYALMAFLTVLGLVMLIQWYPQVIPPSCNCAVFESGLVSISVSSTEGVSPPLAPGDIHVIGAPRFSGGPPFSITTNPSKFNFGTRAPLARNTFLYYTPTLTAANGNKTRIEGTASVSITITSGDPANPPVTVIFGIGLIDSTNSLVRTFATITVSSGNVSTPVNGAVPYTAIITPADLVSGTAIIGCFFSVPVGTVSPVVYHVVSLTFNATEL